MRQLNRVAGGGGKHRVDGARSWGIHGCRAFTALLAIACWSVLAQTGRAQRVVLLVESRASIHQQAALGFEEEFVGGGQLRRVDLAKGRRDQQRQFEEFRDSAPDLLVAIGTQAARAARMRLQDTPLLYCLALRPIENELVGDNVGGVALEIELTRQLDYIQKALPHLRSIGVVHNDLTSGAQVNRARGYLGPEIELRDRVARSRQEAARQIEDLLRTVLSNEDAFWLLWDPVVANPANFKRLVALSLEYKIPLIAPARPFVEAGALLSVGPDYRKAGEQAAQLALQVLRRDAEVAEFRAQPPGEIVLTVNVEVARRLGIEFPVDLPRENLAPPQVAANTRAP